MVETGVIYNSAREAAKHIGGDRAAVHAVVTLKRKSHMGLHFEFVDPPLNTDVLNIYRELVWPQ